MLQDFKKTAKPSVFVVVFVAVLPGIIPNFLLNLDFLLSLMKGIRERIQPCCFTHMFKFQRSWFSITVVKPAYFGIVLVVIVFDVKVDFP